MVKSRGSARKGNQAFLFINKDASSRSLSKSDGAVAKQINRHAQHFRNRIADADNITTGLAGSPSARRIAQQGWDRRDSTQHSSSDESSPVAGLPDVEFIQTPSSPPRATEVPSRCAAANKILPSRMNPSARPPLGGNHSVRLINDAATPERPCHEDGGSLELLAPVYRANFTAYDCVDPFGTTPVQITSQIHTVLQYTLRIYSYAGNNYKLAFLPPHVRSSISQFPMGAVVQRSVYREHHLYSLMAAMTARLQHIFDVGTGSDPEEIRAAALHHLRNELLQNARSGSVDKQTVLDILFIVVNELQYRRYASAKKHLEIVGKLLPLLDLNELLDRWISETAAHVDNQYALATASRPVIPSSFDPGPMLPERMSILKREAQNLKFCDRPDPTSLIVPRGPRGSLGLTDAISDLAATLDVRMGSRFAHGLTVGAFPGRIGRIVADLVDCIEIAKVVWLSPLAVCFDAEWLCRKARAVLRALIALSPENYIGPADLTDKCMECARMCLMILMTHACTLVGFQTAQSNAKRLQKVKQEALEQWGPSIGWSINCVPFNPDERLGAVHEIQAGFVLWSLLTGAWSAEGLPDEEWFLERAVNICRYFGYTTYEDLHNHMAQYLYSSSLQEPSLRKAAGHLQRSAKDPGLCPGRRT